MKLAFKKALDYWLGGAALLLLYVPVRLLGFILRRKHELEKTRHLCVVKLLGGGSLFMIIPTLHEIREKFPGMKLSLVCSPAILNFAKTYQQFEVFDEIRVIDDSDFFEMLKSTFKILEWLFQTVETTLDLEVHSRLTTVLTTMAMVHNRIGLINQNSLWRKRIYTHAIYVNLFRGLYDSYDAASALFGIQEVRVGQTQQRILDQLANVKGDQFELNHWDNHPKILSVGVGCSDLAYERMLSAEQWAKLLSQVLEIQGVSILFLGGPNDSELVEKIISLGPESLKIRSTNLCGSLTLEKSMVALSKSQCFVGIDSALIHLARFLQVPSASFWGPTNPLGLLRQIPLREKVIYSSIYCSPCVHLSEFPPCQGQNLCMDHESKFPEVLQFIRSVFEGGAVVPPPPGSVQIPKFSWVYLPSGGKPQKINYSVRF